MGGTLHYGANTRTLHAHRPVPSRTIDLGRILPSEYEHLHHGAAATASGVLASSASEVRAQLSTYLPSYLPSSSGHAAGATGASRPPLPAVAPSVGGLHGPAELVSSAAPPPPTPPPAGEVVRRGAAHHMAAGAKARGLNVVYVASVCLCVCVSNLRFATVSVGLPYHPSDITPART